MNGNSTRGMPDDMGIEQGTGHIWLRYATQFSVGERTYTIDMGIPVPVGADEETRERLLREADEGMDQLTQHVEQRVEQVQGVAVSGKSTLPVQKSAASTPKFTAASATPAPSTTGSKAPAQGNAPVPLTPPASPASSTPSPAQNVPAAAAPTRESSGLSTSSQAGQSRPPTPEPAASTPSASSSSTQKKPATVPPTRQNIGASMPPTPGLPSGTLQLPQFLQYIQEMGLNARQAMDMLKVKSLSGLNLRDALERLQDMVMSEGATASTIPAPASRPVPSQTQAQSQGQTRATGPKPGESNSPASASASVPGAASSRQPARPAPTASSTPSTSSTPSASRSRSGAPSYLRPVPPAPAPQPVSSPPSPQAGGTKSSAASQSKPPTVREERPPYPVFDEEEDEELEDFDFDEEDEDEDTGMGAGVGLSAANRGSAEDIVSGLREVGGSSVVSALRLKALHNVVDGQIAPEQLQELIRGVWGVASDKKLKSEQAEALISWGKQDDFATEAEMVLALFEEDGDARSDR